MGQAKYYSIYPSLFKLDGGAMFGIIPKPLWEKKLPADELNRIEMNCRVFVIKIDEKYILIDLGAGDYHDAVFNERFGLEGTTHPIAESLQKMLGITPEEISDIVLTHLHFDHIGGLGTSDGVTPLFPNATLHIHQKHFEYALNPTPKDRGSFHKKYFQPLIEKYDKENKVHWITEGDEGLILQTKSNYELRYKLSFGHTPYQILPYDQKMIYLGDLVPTAHHLHLPWVMGYDMQPGESSLEKIKIYDFVIKNNLTAIFDHDKDHWGAKIKKEGPYKYKFSELFKTTSKQYEVHSL